MPSSAGSHSPAPSDAGSDHQAASSLLTTAGSNGTAQTAPSLPSTGGQNEPVQADQSPAGFRLVEVSCYMPTTIGNNPYPPPQVRLEGYYRTPGTPGTEYKFLFSETTCEGVKTAVQEWSSGPNELSAPTPDQKARLLYYFGQKKNPSWH